MALEKFADRKLTDEQLEQVNGGFANLAPDRAGIVSRAHEQLGKPYYWGACGPDSFDDSGLVSYAVSGKNSRIGTTYTFLGWPGTDAPQPGDICVNSQQCGIFVGGGMMINANSSAGVVKYSAIVSGMKYVIYPY